MDRVNQPMMIYQLKITLYDSKPPIWRRVEVDGAMTLDQLHDVIQRVMGWADYHLHQFEISNQRFGNLEHLEYDEAFLDESRHTLQQVIPVEGVKFDYEYDFGDSWYHTIEVEQIKSPEPDVFYPRCVKGKRACPPEDCGGFWGYEELLSALADPKHPEHKNMREWIGGDIDPEWFDLKEINQALAELPFWGVYSRSRKPNYTAKQGQYLAFIYYYTKLNRRPPAHADIIQYFKVTPPTVNNMLKTLDQRGFIQRIPGQARSIRLLLSREELPDLE